MDARTIFYTPKVHNTPRLIDKDVRTLQDRLGWMIEFDTAGSNFKLRHRNVRRATRRVADRR